MMMPEKGKFYLVKIIDHKNSALMGVSVKVKFTGILFRSLKTREFLFLSQIEIIKEIEDPGKTTNQESSNQQELAL